MLEITIDKEIKTIRLECHLKKYNKYIGYALVELYGYKESNDFIMDVIYCYEFTLYDLCELIQYIFSNFNSQPEILTLKLYESVSITKTKKNKLNDYFKQVLKNFKLNDIPYEDDEKDDNVD